MVSKNNRDLYLRRSANKVSKYTIKKLSVGVTSVLVGTAFFIGSTSQANASEQETTQQSDTAVKASDTSSTNDSSRLKVQEASQDQASTSTTSTTDADQAQATENTTSTQASTSTTSTNDAQDSSADEINQTNTQVENNKQEATTANQAESNNDSVLSNNNVANSAESQAKANEETAATPQDTAGFRRANVDTSARALAANTDNTIADVSSWQELISAMGNSNYQTINVNGAITASSNGNIGSNGHNVTVKGNNGSINFGNNTLVANGGAWNITFEGLNITTGNAKGVIDLSATSGNNTVTFKDVTQSGTSLYGGGGNTDVVIDGTTTSTVDNASAGKANTYNATSREANIHDAKSVTVANGANFTLNRSSIGDGINLPDGSTVKVGDDATFTVNMNTNNATDSARYHNAGIFMQNGGNFVTGRNSVVNMNTSIGQAISMGVKRPADGITDKDRFGGYGTGQSRNAGPSKVELGENSTFNFTGRDGIILGNNSSFVSGEYSKVHFQNKGRGVALDLANDSNITISKHSDTLFESNGKTGTSGSYDGYNYIGVNEGGNILIDEFATFRVILTNRGDNPWDDVISLDSRGSNTSASFVSKKGAIIDIRDDNTNFYAELISFPLGAANSKIDIQDPLYVNLQRYSAGGAITGWMNVGGVDINTTNDKYTANLIYMGGNKGTLRIGGTDYVVYQQIKSDGTKQIWLDVNDVTFNKSGFNSKDHYNNGANPDISISGSDLVAGVKANNIKDDNNSPTSGKDAPYYGISTMRASHQIWFPHGTTNQAAGTHKNVIKYVYEDGTEAAPTVTQEVDMTRDMTLAITPDKIKDIQNYASTHTSDETLAYIRNNYAVTEDSGWQIAKGVNTKTAYDAVNTPKIDGYEAQIKSTNANGVTVGSAADTVKANLDIPDEIVKDGQLTDAYKNNGVTGIPQDYETVVVYKKAVQDQSVTIIYQDKSDNNKVLATDTVKGKPGTELGYTTADKITDFENKGYKLVSDGVPKNGTFGNEPETYYVTLEHATTTVTPDPKDPDEVAPQKPGEPINPNDPEGPKWPDEAGEDAVKKPVKATVNYTGAPENPTPNVQNANLTKTVTIDKVTGKVISETPWTPDKDNYDPVKTPVVDGYYADTAEVPGQPVTENDITTTVTYKPLGKIVPKDKDGNEIPGADRPQYNNDPNDPTKGGETPVPTVPGYHLEDPSKTTVTPDPKDPGKDTPVIYVKDEADKYTLVENFVDEAGNKLADSVTKGTDYEEGNDYDVTGDAQVIKGYYLKEVPTNAKGTFGSENVTVNFVYAKVGQIVPVDPEGNEIPDAPTPDYTNDPDDPTKVVPNQPTPEVPGWHVVPNQPTPGVSPDGKTVTPPTPGDDTKVVYEKNEENKYSLVENFVDEAGNKLADSVTKGTDYKEGADYDVTGDTQVIKGYYLKEVPANAKGTFGSEDVTVNFVYAKVGKIVPQDPEGNPIPDAPTPDYTNDPDDPTKVTPNQPVPEIPGYTPEVPTVTPDKPGEDTPVIYVKNQDQKAVVKYIDDTTGETLEAKDLAGKAGATSDYRTADTIANYVNKGYELVSDNYPADGVVFDDDDKTTQSFEVHLKHGTTPVTPENPGKPGEPINPNDPEGPKWPEGTDKDSVQKPVKETVHYTGAGDKTPADVVQDATWTRELTVDKVTGKIINEGDWKSDKDNYDEVKTPVVEGYVADKATVPSTAVTQDNIEVTVTYTKVGKIVPVDPEGNEIPGADQPSYKNDPDDPTKVVPNQPVPEIPGYTPEVPTVTPDKPGEDTPVIYVKSQDQKAVVKYIDDTTGETLEAKDLAGKAGATSDYRTTDTIANYVNKGYELVSDNYPENGVVFDDDDKTTQSFEVHLKHGTTPVTPEKPGKPGEPINPNDPDGPKWPEGTDKDSVQKNVKETVHYVGADDKTPSDVVQDATWTRELTVDKVTGKIINEGDWKSDKDNYDEVKTPVVEGYVADKATVPSTAVTQDNIEVTVTYTKVGKIVPVDPEGNEIPDAPTPDYTNDPDDPTKVVPNQPVPEIPGYTPEVPTVTPDKPGEDTPVKYVPVTPEAKDQTAKIIYRDETTGQDISSDSLTGKSGSKIDYSTADKIKELTDKGYVLVNDGFPAGVTFDNDDNVDQTYYVTFKHGTTPVTPEKPGKPGEPINPNDPDGPKWPEGTDKDSVQKNVKETVHYVGAGDKTPSDVVQDATWTRELTVDKVTGEIVSTGDWKSDKDNYDEVKNPVVEGYVADKATIPSTAVTQDNIEVTVTYTKVGKIVPVDPEGNEIPGVDQPSYNNDPEDPTKVTPNQPVPEIPGFVPEVPTVTPDKPGEDTPVKYVPVTPEAKDQTAKVIYRDLTTDADLASDSLTGKAGSKIDYSTADKIKELLDKGYVLVTDGFPADATFDDNDDVDQVYYVSFKHGEVPVGPDNPHTPGEPINPNDPNGPKWPTTDEYSKEFTSTVHFVDDKGNKLRDDDVQTSTWTRTLIVDTVTGEIKNPNASWTPDKGNYKDVKVPVITGYYADKANVPGAKTQQQDLEVTVTYREIGKIVPVDPNGNKIPDAPTPQYQNDPEDPTKVTITDTPKVPGYTTSIVSVTPGVPGEDTPVIYTKVETPQTPVEAPTTPAQPEVVTPAPAKEAPQAAAELPQMGDENETTMAAVGAAIVAATLGLVGFGVKKKDEKNF
ncbi:MucBP domain-containing protein [Ligilactobacillus murinus]|uniref:mucin-binding protein n=1 Tax=Ligilactobacillus murinus TaxID=1622 RepID=UPI00296AD92F|nr:MucBP domain-containing protein [Ligilactobacillus murinus]WOY89713.1 MucBP domain-containing protein [Ligilactobacillus murinus]